MPRSNELIIPPPPKKKKITTFLERGDPIMVGGGKKRSRRLVQRLFMALAALYLALPSDAFVVPSPRAAPPRLSVPVTAATLSPLQPEAWCPSHNAICRRSLPPLKGHVSTEGDLLRGE